MESDCFIIAGVCSASQLDVIGLLPSSVVIGLMNLRHTYWWNLFYNINVYINTQCTASRELSPLYHGWCSSCVAWGTSRRATVIDRVHSVGSMLHDIKWLNWFRWQCVDLRAVRLNLRPHYRFNDLFLDGLRLGRELNRGPVNFILKQYHQCIKLCCL